MSTRVNILSAIWGVIVILWVPADLILLPVNVCVNIVAFRIFLGLLLLSLSYKSHISTTLKSAMYALYLMIFSVNLFYVYIIWALSVPEQNISIPYGYHLLPIVHIAILCLFPITIKESVTLVLITTIAPVTVNAVYGDLFSPENPAIYWLQLIIAASIFLTQISKLRLMMVMYREATLDPLTGIYNRRQFLTLAQRIFERCNREKAPFSVMLLDIDKFKQVNDTWGHSAGDNVLQAFAAFIQNNLRATNLFGRYGGEEFVICIPHTSPEHISIIAERLLNGLAALDINLSPFGTTVNITASIGISYSEPGDTLSSLIERADTALYRCKNGGRNCYRIEPLSHSTSETHLTVKTS